MKARHASTTTADNAAQPATGIAKHTPGPWEQCPGPDFETEARKRGSQLFIRSAVGIVAEARRMATFGPVQDVDLANAKLMASSPDLLAALDHESLREVFGQIEDSGTTEATKLWAMLQTWFEVRDAAIRKATLA